MTFSRTDFIFLTTNALLLALCVSVLSWHMNLKIERSGDVEPVGVLTFKRFEVLRKYQERVVWEDIETQSPVYPLDSILTKENSDARLELNNGIVFDLAPNSMVVLENFKNKTALKLKTGKVNSAGAAGSESAFILTELGQAIDISNAEASMTISEEGALSMAVNSGAVMIETETGEKQAVEQGENLSIDKEANIKIEKINVNIVEPADGHVIIMGEASTNMRLQWEAPEAIPDARLVLSNTATFEKKRELNVTGEDSIVITARPGTYFWKVTGAGENRQFASPTAAVNVVQDTPPLLISPVANQTIEYLVELPLVTLNWRNSKLCQMSRVRISNSADFSGSYNQNIVTPMVSMNVKVPEAGTYYWSIECNYGQAGIVNTIKYPVRSFDVVKVSTAKPPVLITPNGAELYMNKVEEGDAKLSWNAIREADRYLVSIYKDRNKNELVTSLETTKNVFSIPENLGLETFYWTVTGVMETGDKTRESEVSFVKVVPMEEITLIEPTQNFVAGVYVDTRRKQELEFVWNRLKGSFQYKLEIASDPGFDSIVRTLYVNTNSAGLSDFPDNGVYHWRVSAYDVTDTKREKKLTASKQRSFELKKSLITPKIEYPRPGALVKGDDLVKMRFRWEESPGANQYVFKIYRKKADSAEILVSELLRNNFYDLTSVTSFSDGSFIWEVMPQFVEDGNVQLTGQSSFATMRVTGLTLPKPEILPGRPDIILSIQ